MTSCYRSHLKNNHKDLYEEMCKVKGLKHHDIGGGGLGHSSNTESSERLPFTLKMLYYLLMKWIAVDDQVLYF
jgi:hypothetical protein